MPALVLGTALPTSPKALLKLRRTCSMSGRNIDIVCYLVKHTINGLILVNNKCDSFINNFKDNYNCYVANLYSYTFSFIIKKYY